MIEIKDDLKNSMLDKKFNKQVKLFITVNYVNDGRLKYQLYYILIIKSFIILMK